jgi:predicted enzyme related to lactoylglutathione lyase
MVTTHVSRFVWHDLMAADVEGAKRFYGELLNWKFKRGEHDEYEHIHAGETGIGGIVKLDPKHGAPPHWVGYVTVENIDASIASVTKHGGKVVMPRTDIPQTGSFAIALDPQGAVVAPLHLTREQPESNDKPAAYTFCWDELMSPDPDAAAKFYSAVFGWGVEHMEMPGFGRYTLFKRRGVKDANGMEKNAAGLMKMPAGVPHPNWLSYVAVPNTDAIIEKAKRLGATVVAPPMDIPNVGRFATVLDPQMAAIAFLAPNS